MQPLEIISRRVILKKYGEKSQITDRNDKLKLVPEHICINFSREWPMFFLTSVVKLEDAADIADILFDKKQTLSCC